MDFVFFCGGGGLPGLGSLFIRLSWPHRIGVAVILLFHVAKSFILSGSEFVGSTVVDPNPDPH